jgi:hypothetical protein
MIEVGIGVANAPAVTAGIIASSLDFKFVGTQEEVGGRTETDPPSNPKLSIG